MSVSWDTFERYKQKGLDARRAGQWDSARIYLLEAARAMLELSKTAQGEELREARRDTAQKLLELAKDCDVGQGREPQAARRPQGRRRPRESAPKRTTARRSANQWIVQEKPTLRFADVAGLEAVKEDIRLKMIYPFEHPELAEKFGIRPGGGVLMYGPPGTGKTMLAKATAGEIDATFFRISPADVLSKWVGEAEQNIKKLFDAAAAEPRSIIFIDEIEALVPARRDDGSSVMQRVVPQILQGVEGFDRKSRPVAAADGRDQRPLAARPGHASPRPVRREGLHPAAGPRRPAEDAGHLPGQPPGGPEVDLDALAQKLEGFSGADIKYVCDRAATIPFLASVASGVETGHHAADPGRRVQRRAAVGHAGDAQAVRAMDEAGGDERVIQRSLDRARARVYRSSSRP